jgi:hypothetical protein
MASPAISRVAPVARPVGVGGAERPLEEIRVDLVYHLCQRMFGVDDLIEQRSQQVLLAVVLSLRPQSPPQPL